MPSIELTVSGRFRRMLGGLTEARRDQLVALGLGVTGFWLSWVLTGPHVMTGINWDQGVYVSTLTDPGNHWSRSPWNAHFAIGQEYWIGIVLARLVGGTPIQGFRFITALCFGVAAALVADGARRLSGSRTVGALLGLAWMTAWYNLFFLFTLEDNVLYLPVAAGVLWVSVIRIRDWRWRDSALAGALVAWGALQSWQALLYFGPPLYAAAIGGGPQLRRRVAHVALTIGAFFAGLVAWCMLLAATSSLSLLHLLKLLFSRPEGNFAFNQMKLRVWERIVGLGAGWGLTHTAYDPPPLPMSAETLGRFLLLLHVAIAVGVTVVAVRKRRWEWHLLGLGMLGFAVVIPAYRDVEYRFIVRYDFWPLFLAFLAALGFGWMRDSLATRRWMKPARAFGVVAISAIVCWQLAGAARWRRERLSTFPTLASYNQPQVPTSAAYGRAGQSWYGFFYDLRRANPGACRYLFALGEIQAGWWWPDVVASLYSELHEPVFLVGDPASVRVSRYRTPPIVTPADVRSRGLADSCAVVSRDALSLIAKP